MSSEAASTASIDYLQRSGVAPDLAAAAATSGGEPSRRLLRVAGIGRPDKEARSRRPDPESLRWRPPTAELITGLYGYRIPLAFQVVGSPEGVRVHLGTWSARTGPDQAQDRRIEVIESVLRGLYPVIDLEPAPAATQQSPLVLAYPASEGAIGDVRSSILNEMRAISAAAEHERAPSPLTEQYLQLLKAGLVSAGEGMATGSWRTAVYLMGDATSYPGLASAWRSVMSGDRSLPEPVRVFDDPRVEGLARHWAMPDSWGLPGPGSYRRPFECQTLLSTAELAAIVHLPELESPGYRVDLVPRFDVVARPVLGNGHRLRIGNVLQNRKATAGSYDIPVQSLSRHVFVAGTTGSGKTNTIMALLEEVASHGVPFLVIEPTKAEYRALTTHPRFGS